MRCCECDTEVTPKEAHHEVVGWEHDRAQGGTNMVSLRKRTGRVMCNSCMAVKKAGVNPGQATLA